MLKEKTKRPVPPKNVIIPSDNSALLGVACLLLILFFIAMSKITF